MTPGDAHRVGVVRPRKPAILPLGPLIFNISLCLSALPRARPPNHHDRRRLSTCGSRCGRRVSHATHIGLVCVARLSGIQGRRKADACASDLGECLGKLRMRMGIIRPADFLRSASSTGLAVRADHHRCWHDLATKRTGDGTRSNKTSTARASIFPSISWRSVRAA